MKKFQHVTVGGTWDHFHLGHHAMLDKAFAVGETVWLGVTTPRYLSSLDTLSAKSYGPVESYEKRLSSVRKYLEEKEDREVKERKEKFKKSLLERTKLIAIDDRFGTTLTDELLEAIIVSPETELIATEINLLRAQKNYAALEVILVTWVLARDGKPIHSTRIRAGEIDREGNVYRLPEDWGVRRLPDELREELKKPLGEFIKGDSDEPDIAVRAFVTRHPELISGSILDHKIGFIEMPKQVRHDRMLISVGDVVTSSLVKHGIIPDISIVDLKIGRKDVYKNVEELGISGIKLLKIAENKAGTINFKAYQALLELVETEARPAVLQIDGEDDLMTLLAIFLAPLNSLIVYGQPGEGIVAVEVTEEKKEEARHLIAKFTFI